ncbi:MAG: DUF3267 domain-containing protein [Clostridia bacterium]|nr:DUF3267 domain-containing protein [Clostridia bacterium]
MKLHYMGKFNKDPETLPHGEHKPNAVKFKEATDPKKLSIIANLLSIAIMIILAVPAFFRCQELLLSNMFEFYIGLILSLLSMFPHEFLHAICFKKDVYMYTNLSQGMMFVVGPETMSKSRFTFMSLLPNIVFGIIPYIIGMFFPHLTVLVSLGICATGMGAGDYYNVFNALTQMPKGARTYLYQFNSYWYIPQNEE